MDNFVEFRSIGLLMLYFDCVEHYTLNYTADYAVIRLPRVALLSCPMAVHCYCCFYTSGQINDDDKERERERERPIQYLVLE